MTPPVPAALFGVALLSAPCAASVAAGALDISSGGLHWDPFVQPELEQPLLQEALQPQPAAAWNPTLRAVLLGSRQSLANIDGQVLGVGDSIGGHRLVEIREREVVFETDGRRQTIELQQREPGRAR